MADVATGVARRTVRRVDDGTGVDARDQLAVEEPLLIELTHDRDGGRVTESVSVTMRTPGHDVELALGFLFAEGILAGVDELLTMPEARANTIRIALRPGVPVDLRRLERHFYTASSCGVCGKTSLDALAAARPIALPDAHPVVDAATIHGLPDVLRSAQLTRHGQGEHGRSVECYHDRIRETVERSIRVLERRELYAALARALGGRKGTDAELLSRCLEGAGALEEAAQSAELAG
ncbi:MAG: formate dehydrogenase accessory sulfurtransferase FdhD, partial [Gemmatirosa sp.]